jgi:hypothetical protein
MVSSPFISLNSWNQPGTILQAAEPEEMVEGGPEEWGKLQEMLARRRKTGRDSIHPQGAAVGYITYEGAFRFAWFPKISVLAENGFSGIWTERRAGYDTIKQMEGIASCALRAPGQQVVRATQER